MVISPGALGCRGGKTLSAACCSSPAPSLRTVAALAPPARRDMPASNARVSMRAVALPARALPASLAAGALRTLGKYGKSIFRHAVVACEAGNGGEDGRGRRAGGQATGLQGGGVTSVVGLDWLLAPAARGRMKKFSKHALSKLAARLSVSRTYGVLAALMYGAAASAERQAASALRLAALFISAAL